jgi:hypothetical protein
VEPVGAEHSVDRSHLRQRRTEELTELTGVQEVVKVRPVPLRQRCYERGNGHRVRKLQRDVYVKLRLGRQLPERE